MKQSADRFGLRELVVKRHGVLRRQYVHRNLPFLQKIQRLLRNVKAFCHSTREHYDFRAVCQQFLYVGDLNSWSVTRLRLAPVPFTRAAREKFCVFVRFGFALDFKPAPRNLRDSRRTIAAFHNRCHSERSEESRIKFTSINKLK